MSSSEIRRRRQLSGSGPVVFRRLETNGSREKVRALKQIVMKLQEELEFLNEVPALDPDVGLNFYKEVRNFEIELIKRALIHTRGHQVKAARLLQMNSTTLNAKIKQYNIKLCLYAEPAPELGNNGYS